MSEQPIVVVGAGLSGLAAARRIAERGRRAIVFEKSAGLGGRLATRRIDGVPVDHGCPVLDIREGTPLAAAVDGLGRDAAVSLPGTAARALPGGMTALAKSLADGIEIRRNVRVGSLRPRGSETEVADADGAPLAEASRVIVSAPGPQMAELLASAGEQTRAEAVARVAYQPALVLLAGFPAAARSGVIGPTGVFARIVREDEKGRGALGGGAIVSAQVLPSASAERFEDSDDAIAAWALPSLMSAIGAQGGARWWQVKRWRYATPLEPLAGAGLWNDGGRILLSGDVLTGVGLDAVYDSGIAAGEAASA